MEARLLRLVIFSASLFSLGASYRTTNFVVKAPSAECARAVGESAETYRRQLAVQWLGSELPRWPQPCPITVQVGPNMGAGGATSFAFHNGQPFGWIMSIQGSRERILDSVLPHEITHTIFATHFGRPLPRWADEGACTTVEDVSERVKQHHLLMQFLTTGHGIPFNKMFAMKEYPRDILPLYSQGYSLACFLIAQRGRRQFVHFVGDGMRWNDWVAAIRKHYGFQDLSDLQVSWLDWVKHGSSHAEAQAMLATRMGGTRPSLAANGAQDSWYARQADRRGRASFPQGGQTNHSSSRPQSMQYSREMVLEWGESIGGPESSPSRQRRSSGEGIRYDARLDGAALRR